MKKIIYKTCLFAGLFVFATACGKKTTETESAVTKVDNNIVTLTDAQFKNAEIETGKLSAKSISTILKVNGKIDVPPQNIVSVSAPMAGYLTYSKLLPGMHINKGEEIAVLEDQQFIQMQQDYLLAKSALQFAELEYKRQKDLNESKASSDKVTEQAQAEVNRQRIIMNSLAARLQMINIDVPHLAANKISRKIRLYSSITGFVSKVNINLGKYVSPADVLFELIDPSDIHLNIQVFEKDINKLYIGQKIIAYTNVEPAVKYPCEIMLVSKDVNENGVVEVHCHFYRYNNKLIPGLYMNAEIEVSSHTNNSLPEEALVNFEGKDYVFIETGKQQFEMTAVQKGNTENGYVEVLNIDTLKQKDFVIKGAYTLLMKMKNNAEEE
jgi:cobalt-zinc-cadmium efflux system membrane fusion protein